MKSRTEYLWMNVPARRGFVNLTPQVEAVVAESGVREGLVLVNAMHITASVFINDDEPGLHRDYERWLEGLAPHAPTGQYDHNRTGEDNADAHLKRQLMGREVVVAITAGKLEGEEGEGDARIAASFAGVLAQIAVLDIVFSLDSVITAVGMAEQLWVMITAVVLAVGVMLFAAGPVSAFVSRHPTVKMLALAFLLLIGMSLIAEGLGHHIPKGYVYFAMGFSVFVEALNLRVSAKRKAKPVHLHGPYSEAGG
jgi:secondary thiamine-phosphate synthase enzyme